MTIKISKVLSPAFREVHDAIRSGTYNQFVLKGGRGSTKSSYVSVEMVLLLLKNPQIHLVIMRKVANTLRTTVFSQYQWAIDQLGLSDKFKYTVSPMEIVYKPTGQKILFFGADDPGKIKSIKVPFGYIGALHLEELDQFEGEEQVRNIEQSILRGGEIALQFMTFNPPRTAMNWANKYCLVPKANQLVHHSTYRTTPKEWLGKRFIADAEHLAQTNPRAYEHEYMGNANGTGGAVFENLRTEKISDEQISQFDRLYQGVDWGYYPDPWVYNRMYFNQAQRVLYIFSELTRYKASNRDTANDLIALGITGQDRITADSAEPKSIADYRSYGLLCRGAEKGPGSVDYSHKWLQSLAAIIIDPVRCPDTYKEFSQYEYERTRQGEVISGYPDRDNHHIDAVRYGLEQVWKRRGK